MPFCELPGIRGLASSCRFVGATDLDAYPVNSPTILGETPGHQLGTVANMAPEQGRGKKAGRRAATWDIHSPRLNANRPTFAGPARPFKT